MELIIETTEEKRISKLEDHPNKLLKLKKR